MNNQIIEIIDKALGGELLNEDEFRKLLEVEDNTREAFLVQQGGRAISSKLAKGEIHGQVGLDLGTCPMDCQYCSFAKCNGVFTDYKKTEEDIVLAGAKQMEDEGANAIYLMSTAVYDFDKFLEMGRKVRKILKDETPLIANVGDFDEEGGKKLLDAGFRGIYHALRLGEGVITKISPEKRKKTIESAKKVGLVVGTCLEPVGPEHTIDEIIEKTKYTRDIEAGYSGAGRRIDIPTSPLYKYGMVKYNRMATIVAAVALYTGEKVIGNCTHEPNELSVNAGANLLWAEVGSNPRDTKESTNRGYTVKRCREIYEECGWEVLEGPSAFYKKK